MTRQQSSKRNRKHRPTKWRIKPGKPLRIGDTIIKSDKKITLTISGPGLVKRIRTG